MKNLQRPYLIKLTGQLRYMLAHARQLHFHVLPGVMGVFLFAEEGLAQFGTTVFVVVCGTRSSSMDFSHIGGMISPQLEIPFSTLAFGSTAVMFLMFVRAEMRLKRVSVK